jgi:peptidoglycan hydrolase-like protein with peptidoglycan-binding domain
MARDAAAQTRTGPTEAKPYTSAKDIRRLQRLLKLLANQNPARYAKVDPGIVDGTLGDSTIKAITRFQRIIGVPKNPAITRQLFAQIFTAQAEGPAPVLVAKPANPSGCGADGRCPPDVTKSKPVPPLKKQRSTVLPPDTNPRVHIARFAQLVSLRTKGRIAGEWSRLTKANPILLKDQKLIVETADLGARGTYYRILVGPFDGFRAAQAFCTEIQKGGQNCLVRKRKHTKPETRIGRGSAKTTADIPGPQPVSKSAPTSVPRPAPAPVSSPAPAAQPESSPAANPEPQAAVADVVAIEPAHTAPPAAEAVERPVEQASPREGPANRPTPVPSENAPPDPIVATAPLSEANVKASTPLPAAEKHVADAGPVVDKAVTAEKAAPRATTPTKSVVQWLGRVNKNILQPYLAPGMAAVAGTLFGLLILMWWQRRRKGMMFQALQTDPWLDAQEFEFEHQDGEPAADNVLEDLRVQFESPELAECRKVRDSFLHGLAKTDVAEESTVAASEKSMMVNRRLNQMIATDPAAYKSIFLNWVFLNHAAAALERSEYTLKRLDPRIQREFHLLGSFFKIHLLELEARHHVRDRLPNVFATLHQHES